MSEIDHLYTDEIVCPNCGMEKSDSWEYSDSGEIDCNCGITFEYYREVSCTYNTFIKEDQCKHKNSQMIDGTLFSCDDCGKLERQK